MLLRRHFTTCLWPFCFWVFFFLLVVAKGSALDCGRAIAQPLVYRCFYFCVVVVEITVMFSAEAASSGS